MPNCDFYATGDDFAPILDFIFDQPGWILIENASREDLPLRRFCSRSEIEEAFNIDVDGPLLQLYSPSMKGAVIERQITFRPGAVPGARGRTDPVGWGFVQVYLAGLRQGKIRPSHTNCNSVTRAQNWESLGTQELGPVAAWDWREVERISARLNRHIRGLGVGKFGSRVILPAAVAAMDRGATLALSR